MIDHENLDSCIREMCLQMEDETGIKYFQCSMCQTQATNKQDVERHIESKHVLTKPFECELCGAHRKTRREIKRHIRTFHKQWDDFFLSVFLDHDQLDNYIRERCLQSEDGAHYCGVCGKPSKFKQDIERHVESAHVETNPFICLLCGFQAKTRRSLKIHARSHR